MIIKILSDGRAVKAYPLNSSQKMMFLASLKYGSGYPVNNIGCGFYWKGGFDETVMKESIYEAISRCDTMRLRFTTDKKNLCVQYVTEKSELVVEDWDYSSMTVDEAQEKLGEIARENIPMFNREIHKIAIVTFADGYKGLFMRIQHLAMDAYSVKVFVDDIFEIYRHKTLGTAYPKPMKPYIPMLEKDLAYNGSEQQEADKQYWYNTIAKTEEPIFTDFMLDNRLKPQSEKNPGQRYANIHSGLPDAHAKRYSLGAEKSRKIIDMCNERSFSLFAVVSMGVRTALSAFNDNQQDVSFKMIVNRRGTVQEKKSGGLRINFVPMRSIVKPEETFAEAVENITEIQNETYRYSALSFFDMLKERHKEMPADAKSDSTYDSFGLSYQPPVKMAVIDEDMEKTLRSFWYNNGATMIPLYVTVSHRRADGGLDFVFEYRKEPDATYDLHILYGKICRALEMGTENPDVTVGEILKEIEVTQEERNGKPIWQENSKSLLNSLKTTWKLTKSRVKTILSLISA